MNSFRAKAHAKINPYLFVGERRADGYHEIDTIFQAIELHDIVTVSPAEETEIVCSDPSLSGDANLVSQALRLCAEIYEFPPMRVHIEKHIPLQAGLGGGSSDVAAVLKTLDRLSSGALRPQLTSIALACGSDVPFFLGASTLARATGRGEKLDPIPAPEEEGVVLAMPSRVSCSTAEAYARLDAMPGRPLIRPDNMPYNDFERVAPCESLDLLEMLRSFSIERAGLCGSGSAVYGFTPHASQVASKLAAHGFWAIATHTIAEFGEPWTL